MRRLRQRWGFVVAVAIYLLAAIAGLAAASFYAITESRRAANRATRHEEAASAADVELHSVVASWSVAGRDSLHVGGIDAGGPQATQAEGNARVLVIRLTRSIYWLASAGWAAAGTSAQSTRVHSLLVEVLRPAFSAGAALASGGDVLAERGFVLDGTDSPPPGWTDCPAADTTHAPAVIVAAGRAARADDGSLLPDVRVDTGASDATANGGFGRVAAPSLATRATLTAAPGAILSPAPATDLDCRFGAGEAPQANWGEPLRSVSDGPCTRFFPVVHAPGDLTVNGGRGQGVLLVFGRLRITGPFVFNGVVLATGGIDVTGPDVSIYGIMIGGGTSAVVLRAGGEVRRSTCALARVAEAAARVYPVPLRAWAELF